MCIHVGTHDDATSTPVLARVTPYRAGHIYKQTSVFYCAVRSAVLSVIYYASLLIYSRLVCLYLYTG